MAHTAILTAEPAPAIDRDHLKRMTFGEASLEHELLQLFDRQADLLMARMRKSEPAVIATLAHTMKGSARSVGAGFVAQAAEQAERASGGAPAELAAALDRLAQAVMQARAQIAVLLRAA
jgi:HPt (histidine-containing phosphotransfer) domain-containing protein